MNSTTSDGATIFQDYVMKFDVDILTGLPIKSSNSIPDRAMRFATKVAPQDVLQVKGKPFSVARDMLVKELDDRGIFIPEEPLRNILDAMHLFGNQFNVDREKYITFDLIPNDIYVQIKFNKFSNKQVADIKKKSSSAKVEQLSLF